MKRRAEYWIKGSCFLPDLHENVLEDFLGFRGIAQNPNGDRKKRACGLIVELGKRIAIPIGNSAQQLRLNISSLFSLQHTFRGQPAGIFPKRTATFQSASWPAGPLA